MEQFPIPILKSVHHTIERVRSVFAERNPQSELTQRIVEACETVRAILKLDKNEENPYWYTLYEGMIGRYVQMKAENKRLEKEKDSLRGELRELRQKYLSAMAELENQTAQT